MTGVANVGIRAALAVAIAGSAALAQVPQPSPAGSASDCPIVGGVRASVTVRDTGRAAVPRDLVKVERRTSIDTTFTINIVERRWVLSELAASVAAGVADTARGRWYLCAGAAAGLRRPTLVVRGVHGQIRLRASLGELARDLGSRQPTPGRSGSPPRRS